MGNKVVSSVPSARTLDLGLLSLANVCTLTLGPSRRSAALRADAGSTHLLDDGSALEKLFSSLPALDTLVLCKMAISPPLNGGLGRIPNVPDFLPHLGYLHVDMFELERSPDDGSE